MNSNIEKNELFWCHYRWWNFDLLLSFIAKIDSKNSFCSNYVQAIFCLRFKMIKILTCFYVRNCIDFCTDRLEFWIKNIIILFQIFFNVNCKNDWIFEFLIYFQFFKCIETVLISLSNEKWFKIKSHRRQMIFKISFSIEIFSSKCFQQIVFLSVF